MNSAQHFLDNPILSSKFTNDTISKGNEKTKFIQFNLFLSKIFKTIIYSGLDCFLSFYSEGFYIAGWSFL